MVSPPTSLRDAQDNRLERLVRDERNLEKVS